MIFRPNIPNPTLAKVLLVRSFLGKRGLWPMNLKGACGVASFLLVKLLPPGLAQPVAGTFRDDTLFRGHKISFRVDHTWVHIGDVIVDLTIAQFDGFQNEALRIASRSNSVVASRYRVGTLGAPVLRHMERWQRYVDGADLLREAREFMGRHEEVRWPLQRRRGRDLFEPSVQRYPDLSDLETLPRMEFQDPESTAQSPSSDPEVHERMGPWGANALALHKQAWACMVGFDPKRPPLQKRPT